MDSGLADIAGGITCEGSEDGGEVGELHSDHLKAQIGNHVVDEEETELVHFGAEVSVQDLGENDGEDAVEECGNEVTVRLEEHPDELGNFDMEVLFCFFLLLDDSPLVFIDVLLLFESLVLRLALVRVEEQLERTRKAHADATDK